MKRMQTLLLAISVALYCTLALAQRGHAGGMGGNATNGMGHGASVHNTSLSTAHGMTMNQILTKNTALAGKIQKLTGMSAQDACSGFKNLGQCVAAAHVSKNLDVSFACMKDNMTGTAPAQGTSCPTGTGTKKLSLGQSIQALSPHADGKSESNKATKQADQDLEGTNS